MNLLMHIQCIIYLIKKKPYLLKHDFLDSGPFMDSEWIKSFLFLEAKNTSSAFVRASPVNNNN